MSPRFSVYAAKILDILQLVAAFTFIVRSSGGGGGNNGRTVRNTAYPGNANARAIIVAAGATVNITGVMVVPPRTKKGSDPFY